MRWVDLFGLAKKKLPYNHQVCVQKRRKFNSVKRELKGKLDEVRINRQNLPFKHEPGMAHRESVEGHLKAIEDIKLALQKHQKWLQDNCEDQPPPPPLPNTKCSNNSNSFNTLMVIGVVGTAALVGGLHICNCRVV
ncbi:hypothetical protein [Neisseria zalophi]|uniref:hypothetical protein n=1 Tax=Neisseria zalophi TaxID=640030 RepID=UPI001CDA1018|nr:hypothetical protein [Neisseria zalophi]